MIDQEMRKAICRLSDHGMPKAQIARSLKVDRKTVTEIIRQKGQLPDTARSDAIEVEPQLLIRLHKQCEGYIERVHEVLDEEHGIKIGYSTLTRKIRQLELGKPKNQRCGQVEDMPGAEMQHDTSVHTVRLGSDRFKLVTSLLYLRYSKQRYLKFYRTFDRFKMKGFLHEALMFWGYCPDHCIIDNTNLARLRGTGKNAVIAPEMEQFAKRYGFQFVCHEKGHANRKAGNERGFYTVETNFLPGRQFNDLTDLNRQAFEWATIRVANRPVGKTGLIPARAFEYEQGYLKKLPPYITAPYMMLTRDIDQYGYLPVDANYYWVPGVKRFEARVLQYPDHIKVYHQRNLLIEYKLAPEDVKNQKIYPPGHPKPKHQPSNRKKPTDAEEKKLRSASGIVNDYLNFVLNTCEGKKKHQFIRQLHALYQKMSAGLFDETIRRALTYRIDQIETIERIGVLQMKEAGYRMPPAQIDEQFKNRQAFIDGRFSDDVDLSVYEWTEKEDDNG